jgi:hypothetical protein
MRILAARHRFFGPPRCGGQRGLKWPREGWFQKELPEVVPLESPAPSQLPLDSTASPKTPLALKRAAS